MQTKNVTEIRSLCFTKVNQLVRAARHIEQLRPAFAEWEAGEIYVCKKTGGYRYRFGDKAKSPAPWSKTAESLFPNAAAFAFAAMVLAPEREEMPVTKVEGIAPSIPAGRANIIQLASRAA